MGWLCPTMVLLAWLLSVVAAQGQKSTTALLPTLTHVEQIRRMSIEEAGRGYPVRLRAVVTYYNWGVDDLFIQDSTAGIWVSPGQTKLALHQGELVEVEGISGVGDLAPAIDHAHFRSLGEAPMPNPRIPTSDELASGRLDSQWIELQGVVRSLAEREGGLVLNVSSGAFECRVFILKYPSLPTDVVDGQVRVRGVFAGLYDPRSVRVVGFQVLTPSWSEVKVLQRPAQNLWSVPVRPIRLFMRLTPEGAFTHRVRVRGVVTLQQLGQFLCIRDSEGALLVNTNQPTALKVGDLVDALGYPALGDYTVVMRDAIFQRAAAGPAPEPAVVSPENLRAGNHNADLVRLSARLLNWTTLPGEQILELQAGQVDFRATLNTGTNSSPFGSLRLGSLLQLTGVMMVEADKNHEPKGFEILLRSPADVVVLELPSWWTAQRISWLLVTAAAILFWISFWVAALRRRVKERTETIRATLESTADGILVVNSVGKIAAYNRKFAEMWGIPESVLASRDENVALNFALSQLKDPDAFLKTIRQTHVDRDVQTDDVIEFKDGRIFERHSEPQRTWGRNIGRVWAFRNVTERKRTEEELHHSRQMLQLVLDNIPQRVFWKDRNFNYLGCNRACALDSGLQNPAEIIGKNDFELSWRETADLYRADDTLVMEQGSPKLNFEEPQKKLDGSSMWLRTSKLPLRDREGKVIGVIGTYEDITERKRAEEALRESEARYRGLFESSLEGIGVSKGNEVIDANRALLDIFGYSDLEEFTAIPLLEHVAPQSRGLIKEMQEKRGRGDPCPKRFEYQIARKDGQTRTLEVSTDAVYFGGGRYTQSTFRDVTERKRAEEALRESEARFRAVFENAAIGVTLVDMHGHPVESNLAFQKMLGYSARELAQMAFTEFTHPDDARASREPFADLWKGKGGRYQLEKRYCRKDGQIVWGQLTVSLVRNQSGEPRYAIGLIEDISERKRAEEALRASEEHLRSFIENVPLGVYRTTPDGRVLMANPALLRMLGYDSLQELVSRNLERDGFEAGYPRSAFREQLERQGEVRGLEATWKRRDGSVIFVRESARAVRAGDGSVLYYDGTIEDVTERMRLEEQLRQAQKMEAVGRLAAGVAHDFNNLLTIVIGYSDLALQRLSTGNRMRPPLEEIKKAGERAAWLTRQLLAFSRKQVLQPQILDLNSLLANVDQMLRRVIGEDIELVMQLPPGLGRVQADPGQIEQVIVNLAVNARDAMPQGGRLTLEAANVELDSGYASSHQSVLPGQYVMFAMSDTGIGMDAKTQARIFEPFFTTKEPGKGTGLGLSTVYGIVKQSGGYIWAYSEPGKGAAFKVYLPRIDQPAEAMAPGEPGVAELPLASETVLLVEDEKAVRNLAREVLECRGYHVLEAAGALEALEVAERYKKHIHLLLTDVVMPQMGGRELAEQLARLHPETKVLFMSGYADNAVVHHGLLDPGTALLQKPFTAQALARKLREVLDSTGDHKAGFATCPPATRGSGELCPGEE
jgi:PAS domain S-box-containing protein